MSAKIIDRIVLLVTILMVSGASVFNDDDSFLIVIFTLFCAFFVYRKRRLDPIIPIIIGYWIIVNVFSSIFNSFQEFNFNTFSGYLIRLSVGYLALKVVGRNFWEKFEKYIFFLTAIGIPVFLLDFLFPDFFDSLKSIFEPFTNPVVYEKESQGQYWYSFFYTHGGIGYSVRNSGFMWEPGAFAMMIIIMIVYNWCKLGIRIDRRIIIYLIALFTTLSTAGFLAFGLLMIIYLISRKKFIWGVLLGVIVFVTNFSLFEYDFLGPKIESYIEEAQQGVVHRQAHTERYEANRYAFLLLQASKSLDWPLGYGVLKDDSTLFARKQIVGVSGMGEILYTWGWIGFLFVVFSLIKLLRLWSGFNFTFSSLLFVACILITFFSNPIEHNLILYLIVLTPFLSQFKVVENDFAFEESEILIYR